MQMPAQKKYISIWCVSQVVAVPDCCIATDLQMRSVEAALAKVLLWVLQVKGLLQVLTNCNKNRLASQCSAIASES